MKSSSDIRAERQLVIDEAVKRVITGIENHFKFQEGKYTITDSIIKKALEECGFVACPPVMIGIIKFCVKNEALISGWKVSTSEDCVSLIISDF